MRRLAGLSVLLFVSLANSAEIQVGAAAIAINPPEGTPLAGYYDVRGSKKILDDIFAKAIVIESNGTRAALVVCDLITMPRHVVVDARRKIEAKTKIPGANVMISATHTHTGPVLARESPRDDFDGSNSELGIRYTNQLADKIATAVIEAEKKLTTVHVAIATGHEENISHNRRFLMKDGTVSWNPTKNNPNIVKAVGPIDPDVGIAYFETPKQIPIATYVNFAMHPDTVGGLGVSADYPGVLSKQLAEYRGPEMLTMFANGCCGNINHRYITWANGQGGPRETHRLGTALAGAVFRVIPELKPIQGNSLRVKSEIVKLALPKIDEEDIRKARDLVKSLKDPKTKFMDKVQAFKVLDVEAQNGKPIEVEVQVVALGDDLAFVSLPGEIFVELGIAIKKASPFKRTMIAELANGAIGYIPNREAYPQGNYEVISARCAEGSGELLMDAAVRLLKELKAK